MFKMPDEELTEKVEEIIKSSKNRKDNKIIIPPNLFLYILNNAEGNPEFELRRHNERAFSNMFVHEIEYKGYYFVSTTHRKIYNPEEEFYKTDLI